MIGCLARATTRDIVVDGEELEDARWFTRDEVMAMFDKRHPEGLTRADADGDRASYFAGVGGGRLSSLYRRPNARTASWPGLSRPSTPSGGRFARRKAAHSAASS